MLILKDAQMPPKRETPLLSIEQIIAAAYPRHEYHGADYRRSLASHKTTALRFANQIGLRFVRGKKGRPRKKPGK
jgi:hypothetical protein